MREGLTPVPQRAAWWPAPSPRLAELELGRERRTAARVARRARGQSIGRPKAFNNSQAAHASHESANAIAETLGVSRATVYRVLAEDADE
jgi:DNA invertase Pin-like site-specific DNA recombinase